MIGFSSEQELVTLFKRSYTNRFSMNNNKILEEVGLGFGIADIVITELKDNYYSTQRDELNSIDINIYQIVKRVKRITLETIAQKTRISRIEASKSLQKLIEFCYIKEVDTYYEFSNKYELSYKKSIAFEAKLRNWKKALLQAYRYKWFAEYSYVILDDAHSNPAIQNIDSFEKMNVGLLTITTDGIIKENFHPKRQKPIDPSMQMLLSEFIYHSDN